MRFLLRNAGLSFEELQHYPSVRKFFNIAYRCLVTLISFTFDTIKGIIDHVFIYLMVNTRSLQVLLGIKQIPVCIFVNLVLEL
jgi:hypothetical protein